MLSDEEPDLLRLHQAGVGAFTIARLQRLRRMYVAERDRLHELDTARRLHFVRWLVRTGKLTEQIAEVQERQ